MHKTATKCHCERNLNLLKLHVHRKWALMITCYVYKHVLNND